MGAYAVVDTQSAPIVRVQVVGEPDDESYQEYLDDLGAAFRALPHFAMLLDAGNLGGLPSKYRDQQTHWLKNAEAELKGRWIASAFVLKSPIIRAVLHTMFWIHPPYFAHKVARNQEEAFEWIQARLTEAGVKSPSPRVVNEHRP